LTPLPSIQKALEQGKANADSDKDTKALDTQTLLERAASTKKAQGKPRDSSNIPSSPRKTRSMSIAAQSAAAEEEPKDIHAPLLPRVQTQRPEPQAFPCTPADQLIQPRIRATPAAAAVPNQPAPTTALSSAIAQQSLPPEVTDILNTHPSFGQAEDGLASFASLESQQQAHVLEKWCIHMYRNEDFRVLCRVLGSSLRAQLALEL
jgi:hypothetical protein